ncbi:hypothetical protein [Deefgea piscis]|uniref:hypothetical protein n=1 Tax=Deefgea piscis TaxID=2739061 RepID=UPI001C7FC68E|nr:hypothetical protein [Deefgea piscis]QZA80260.1 hypothetical protein K4H25_12030 [Deefgea piscis]
MTQLKLSINPELTMSSLEMVDFINASRKESEAELRHDHFMAKVPKVLGEEAAPNFRGSYQGKDKTERPCYHFPKREACLMAMSYSYDLQAKVFDRMTELEAKVTLASPAPSSKPLLLSPSKEFRELFGIARLIGLDKPAAAISANQATLKKTGVNLLAELGHEQFESPNNTQFFTPTELGKRINVSGRQFNLLLAEAGLQAKKGEDWSTLPAAEGFCRVLDTGKRHGDGAMIQQIKWAENVIALLKTNEAEI